MTAPLQGVPDPQLDAELKAGIAKLRASGYTDDEIRQEWLVGKRGLTPDRAAALIPTMLEPPRSAPVYPHAMVGKMVPDLLLAGVRGATLSASKHLEDVAGLGERRDQFRRDHPALSAGAEMVGSVAFNPFSWIKGFSYLPKGVRAAAEFLAPGEHAAKAGVKEVAKRIGGQAIRGGVYGGIVGANEAGLPGALSGFAGGSVLGTVLGTVVEPFVSKAAQRQASAATGLGPKARSIMDDARKAQAEAGIPPVTPADGQSLFDVMGPLEQSVFQEAVRRSPEGLVEANRFKQTWMQSQKEAPTSFAMEIAGVPKTLPNPLIVARDAKEGAKKAAQPFYDRLNRENPVVPMTPDMQDVLADPNVRNFLLSPAFKRFAQTQATADKIRQRAGEAVHGEVMKPDQIMAALGELPPEVQAKLQAAQRAFGRPLDEATKTALLKGMGFDPGTAQFDWRTLNYVKMAMDKTLFGKEPVGSLATIDRSNLLTIRNALVGAMDQMPTHGAVYRQARNTFASGQQTAEMLARGMADAKLGAQNVQLALTDPAMVAYGPGARDQYRFGVLSELHKQLSQSGGEWTPDRVGMMKLLAFTPDDAAKVDAFVAAQEARSSRLGLIPNAVQGIQTRGEEGLQGRAMGALVSGGFGNNMGFRLGNAVQAIMAKMGKEEARDLVRAYLNPQWRDVLQAVENPFLRPASRVGELSGRGVGTTLGTLIP